MKSGARTGSGGGEAPEAPEASLQAYRVGGAVRDALLGRPGADRDWVVVGATPERMIALGFRPVGKDFPVFLHPRTNEEYALARTERKTGPGYKGFAVHFAPGVTLEEDLARRDLTINAIAQDADGRIIDPFNGQRDIEDRVLRHVSDSFVEDPVRILRLARFAARFQDFSVAPETMALMRRMTAAGEVDALVPERVWQELARGLREARPSRMIEVLQACGALAVLLPELGGPESSGSTQGRHPIAWNDWLDALDRCAERQESLPVCFAVLVARAAPGEDAGDAAVLRMAERLRAPVECRDLGALFAREREAAARNGARGTLLATIAEMDAAALLGLLDRCDGWRKPARVEGLLHAAAAVQDADPESHPGATRLRRVLHAARAIDQGAIAQRCAGKPEAIRDAIRAERLKVIAAAA